MRTIATADTPSKAAFEDADTLLKVRVKPGTCFSYANMGYTLLGMVIEAVTGDRYERYLDQNLLHPLGMHDSTFGYSSQVGRALDPELHITR